MTRLRWGLYIALCAPLCVADCVLRGYGWRNGVRWTWASHRACWAISAEPSRNRTRNDGGGVRGAGVATDGVRGG